MKFVIIGVFVVILIAFFVVVWKAARDWRWYQIVPVCITMVLAMLFLVPVAVVLKSRSAWHRKNEELQVRVNKVVAETRDLKFGSVSSGPGLVELSRELAKLGIEAGRSWRGLRLTDGTSASLTLSKVADDVAGLADSDQPDGDDTQSPLVPQGLVVYAFSETISDPQKQIPVPTFYLGEFRVTASGPRQVSLSPTAPLELAQTQAIDSGQVRQCSLYELLPLDGHQPFIAEGSVPSDENYFGRVDQELVQRLLGDRVDPDTLQSYLDDGRRATSDDPPLSRWIRVEFLQNYAEDVDSEDKRGALDGGFFDASGRAVDARLQRGDGEPVRFKKGDTILIQEIGSKEWLDQGIVKLLDRYYLRPLNDYRFVLRHIRLRLSELVNRTDELNQQKSQLQQAIDTSNGMLVANTETKVKLEQDLEQFQKETSAMTQYQSKVARSVSAMRQEMARLHKQNVVLESRLATIHRSIDASAANLTNAGR